MIARSPYLGGARMPPFLQIEAMFRSRIAPLAVFVAVGISAVSCAPGATTTGEGGAGTGARPEITADRLQITILGTTDLHGRLFPYDYYTGETVPHGLAKVATLVDSIRGASPNVILLDSGDLLQGNPLDYYYGVVAPAEVHPVIRAMNLLAYDASTLGNHEFNYGLPALDRALAKAEFPFLAANVFVAGTDSLRWPPFTVVERGGARIGVLGLTTPGSAIWDRQNVEGELEFRDIVESARRVWPELETASDVQVVAIHSGMGPGSSYDEAATGVPEEDAGSRLAESLPGIDLILLGHSHEDVPADTVNGVLFTQAGKWGEALAVATLVLEPAEDGWRIVERSSRTISTAEVPPDPEFLAALEPYHEAVVAYVADTIGWTPDAWSAADARLEDGPIIDLIQRVQIEASGADLSAAAAFTTDAELGPGAITVADAAALYVYENTLKAIEITGRQLREYLEYSARYFHRVNPDGTLVDGAGDTDLFVDSIPGYNYDIVAGVEYVIDLTQPLGERIRDLTYEGRPVADDQTFTLAINNYRQGGGGGFSMIAGAPVVYDRQEEIRRLLIDWIAERDTIRQEDVFEPSWRIEPRAAVAAGSGPDRDRIAQVAKLASRLPPPLPAGDRVRLAVLATNDFHGALEPHTPSWAQGDTIGGAANLAAYITAVEARYPDAILHLDGGDVMQGTLISNLTYGRSTVDILNRMGLDIAAIGNHEFDWGVDTLRARIAQAEFPWLSANIFVKATGARPEWAEPYAWVERAGLRIAVIGASTVATPRTTLPKNVAPFEFRDIAEVVNELAPRLKDEGADLIFLAVHAGAIAEDGGAYIGEIVDAAHRITAPVDLIVSGHTHTRVEAVVNGIPIVQAASSGTALGIVTLTYDRRAGRLTDHAIEIWTTRTAGVEPVPEVARLVEEYRSRVAEIAERPIARVAGTLRRARGEETALGDLIADAQRWATGDQVAIVNGGGIRTDLQAGPITYADVFRVQPFQNSLISLELTGEQLRLALEGAVADRVGQVSGVRFSYDPTRPPGARVREATLEDGEPVVQDGRAVQPDRTYTLTANSYMAAGGDDYAVLAAAREATNTGLTDSEVLADYLAQLPQPIAYQAQGRIERLAPWPESGSSP
ncbi:MAG TPA: 5'-nucleotidase C-terminal domain-containing protein [Gemmatimonadota bacterium]|nr:5'-nucleotidase C-terminal domain-containing protein [Gemmatimonadota bacterium]